MRPAPVLLLVLAAPLFAADVLNQGNGKDTSNIVVLGDGWTDAKMDEYRASVRSMVDGLFTIDPYEHYRDTIRVTRLDVASRSQGCRFAYPPKSWGKELREEYKSRETAFGVVWKPSEDEDGPVLSKAGQERVDAAIGDIPCKVAIILTPDTEINNGVAMHRPHRSYIVMNNLDKEKLGDRKGTLAHELGHALFGLDDEYCYTDIPLQTESTCPNTTVDDNPQTTKWAHLIGVIGMAPQPCSPTSGNGIFHPGPECRMNNKYPYPDNFCVVCLEGIRGRVQSSYRLIASSEPAKPHVEVELFKSMNFKVKLRPLGTELRTFWQVDGKNAGPGVVTKSSSGWTVEKTIGGPVAGLTPGTHEVRFLVEDGHNDFTVKTGTPSSRAPQARVWWVHVLGALGKPVTLEDEDAWP